MLIDSLSQKFGHYNDPSFTNSNPLLHVLVTYIEQFEY